MEQLLFFDIPLDGLISLAVALAALIALSLIYALRVNKVASAALRAGSLMPEKDDAEYEPVSVVVYSQADADALSELLPVLLSQDYPSPFEVVVVNEGESADVRDAVSLLRMSNPNLYLTFTPDGVRSLSRKKLALTLGVKAARYDVLVFVTTATVIGSDKWLSSMTSKFSRTSAVEVVLGYAAPVPGEDDAFGRRCRSFDYVADSVRWIAPALAGHPFRGTEFNLAYRKKVFLKNNGFARSLNLHSGDDDIFISEIAGAHNTAVELSLDSIVGIRHGNAPRVFRERVLRRCFTESFIRRRPRFLMPLTGWLQCVVAAAVVYAAIVSYPSVVALSAGAVLMLATIAADIYVWRRVMKALRMDPLMLSLPWLSVSYPVRRFVRKLYSRFSHQKKYTWT